MQTVKTLWQKYQEIIRYGIFGVITVLINLALYQLFLTLQLHYVLSSMISYFIASLISYYFNLFFVFHSPHLPLLKECMRLIQYFSVRIGSLIIDTLLLIVLVECFHMHEFYSKLFVSIVVILLTYVMNRIIMKRKEENEYTQFKSADEKEMTKKF